ncbi:glycoside hydrolase family 3 protein [Desulfopila inferna]|uniref:glycoside hydrolase family 3 protein n=1 Tax=Desulfopila inferna TaxID=468528 RepID=UPI0019622BBB|nr:glycoside hydrolase family 3 N-terminal domain-containing protein [Desulfopila inferna]MBM9604389.1 hypothetical protein [Desulfopila inferna]
MDLRKIIGQLFILGFRGATLTMENQIREDIVTGNLGGIILFDNFLSASEKDSNIVSRPQLENLCDRLQSLAEIKLLIGVDQEGGAVRRLKQRHGFPPLPSAAEMGRDTSCRESATHARRTGELLAAIGINCDFAPVADINVNLNNPIIGKIGRSFSSSPREVAAHCEQWLDGLKHSGVLGCLKHFPGHGSSTTDSHKGWVDISRSWKRQELIPYAELIEKGKVQAVMMGHLFHSDFDAEHPASLSADIIGGLLRGEMHYAGLVITDDLQMRGITERYGIPEAIVQAFSAGVDMIILGNNLEYDPGILHKAVNAVEQAVESGYLSLETLRKSYDRVQKIKEEIL